EVLAEEGERQRALRRQLRRLRLTAAAFGLLACAAVGGARWGFRGQQEARAALGVAEAATAEAEARRVDAVAAQRRAEASEGAAVQALADLERAKAEVDQQRRTAVAALRREREAVRKEKASEQAAVAALDREREEARKRTAAEQENADLRKWIEAQLVHLPDQIKPLGGVVLKDGARSPGEAQRGRLDPKPPASMRLDQPLADFVIPVEVRLDRGEQRGLVALETAPRWCPLRRAKQSEQVRPDG
ncbi:MAG: hypothetical protein ACYDA8_23915, partial [Deferrisomatales bacterium]